MRWKLRNRQSQQGCAKQDLTSLFSQLRDAHQSQLPQRRNKDALGNASGVVGCFFRGLALLADERMRNAIESEATGHGL